MRQGAVSLLLATPAAAAAAPAALAACANGLLPQFASRGLLHHPHGLLQVNFEDLERRARDYAKVGHGRGRWSRVNPAAPWQR